MILLITYIYLWPSSLPTREERLYS